MRRSNRPISLPLRPRQGRILSGVCAGIGEAGAFDPTLLRLAFLVMALAWGLGIVLYIFLWMAMPSSGDGASAGRHHNRHPNRHPSRHYDRDSNRWAASWHRLQTTLRRGSHHLRDDMAHSLNYMRDGWQRTRQDPWPRPLGRRWMAVGLIFFGAIALLTSFGAFSWITPLRAASLGLIILGMAALISLRGWGRES